jgi:hypothetical protein
VGGAGLREMLDHHADGLLRAGLRCFEHLVSVFGGYFAHDGVRMTVDVIEFERIGRDHGAQRVPLATGWVYFDAHFTSWCASSAIEFKVSVTRRRRR